MSARLFAKVRASQVRVACPACGTLLCAAGSTHLLITELPAIVGPVTCNTCCTVFEIPRVTTGVILAADLHPVEEDVLKRLEKMRSSLSGVHHGTVFWERVARRNSRELKRVQKIRRRFHAALKHISTPKRCPNPQQCASEAFFDDDFLDEVHL